MSKTKNALLVGGALLTGVALAFAPVVAKATQQQVEKVAAEVIHRPTAVPDRIILTFKGDPSKSIAVTWRTDTSVAPGQAVAQIAPASAYPKFNEQAVTVNATSTPLTSDLGTAHYHSAEFTGLKPKTMYAYRVGDGTNWSEWIHYTTANDKPEPFTFIYFGDAQNDIKSLWSRAIRSAYKDDPEARFIIHAGDLINNSDTDSEWGEWFNAGGWVNSMVPSIPSPGNHEYNGRSSKGAREGDRKGVSDHWRPQFTLPENGPAGLEETCYYVDYQGTRIISLNTQEKLPEQAQWLDKVLTENPQKWTIVTFHRPVYSTAKSRDNKDVREAWLPIFDKHKVDLVVQGHDHTYGRSRNMRNGMNVRNTDSGTIYVVSVSGPKMYDLNAENKKFWMARAAEDTQLYQIIQVNGDKLNFEARTVTGELYDAFTLEKQKSNINKLVENTPKTPEILRETTKKNIVATN
ncbi:MAG: metallophosphoesterase family protein [Armatimonadaceae bacterium]